MKTMKYIATALMLLSMTSSDLDRLDYTEISPENFFKTETDLKLAVNSLYYDFNPGDFKAVYSADYMSPILYANTYVYGGYWEVEVFEIVLSFNKLIH